MKKAILGTLALMLSTTAVAEDMAQLCGACHGVDGVSVNAEVPTIAGLAAYNISDALLQFQEGVRKGNLFAGSSMNQIVAGVDEDSVEAIAEYYAEKPFRAAEQAYDQSLVAAGEKIHNAKCEKCHSEAGSLADDEAGILAGQWSPYLRATIAEFISGEREGDEGMVDSLKALSDKHVDALIAYYASQQ